MMLLNANSAPRGAMLWANCDKSLVMIPARRTNKTPLQVPQSPLMSESKKGKVGMDRAIPGPRPLTQKITRAKNPMGDFYWGDKVKEGVTLSPRMTSLQRVMGLNYCKSCNPGASACKLHCLWAKYLREDLGDDKSALKFYSFAADMGHARSMYKITCLYLLGQGTESSPKKAMMYIGKLINAGCDHICMTWRACSAALSVPSPGETKSATRVKKAIIKMKASVLQGIDSHYASPWCKVLAIKPDETKMGFSRATLMLGRLYLRASFVGQNLEEALKWLIASSKLGNTDAMCTIGDCFTFNHAGSIPQNVELARKYYTIASGLGHSKSKRRLESLRDWE